MQDDDLGAEYFPGHDRVENRAGARTLRLWIGVHGYRDPRRRWKSIGNPRRMVFFYLFPSLIEELLIYSGAIPLDQET